jgi:hypothetical protein
LPPRTFRRMMGAEGQRCKAYAHSPCEVAGAPLPLLLLLVLVLLLLLL